MMREKCCCFFTVEKKFEGPRVSCFHHFMTGWEEKPSRWFSKRIKKRRTERTERCSHACCSITSLSYPNSNTRENGRLAVGWCIFIYLFIPHFELVVGYISWRRRSSEHLGGNGRGNFTRCHRFSFSSTTAVLCCCYYYTTRVCVYCQAKKWRLGVISGYHVFFVFFLSFPTTTKFSWFSLCRQFDNNFMILFILPHPFYYIQMGCSCLEYWSGGSGGRDWKRRKGGRVSINGSAWSCKSHQVTLGCIRSCASPSLSL